MICHVLSHGNSHKLASNLCPSALKYWRLVQKLPLVHNQIKYCHLYLDVHWPNQCSYFVVKTLFLIYFVVKNIWPCFTTWYLRGQWWLFFGHGELDKLGLLLGVILIGLMSTSFVSHTYLIHILYLIYWNIMKWVLFNERERERKSFLWKPKLCYIV